MPAVTVGRCPKTTRGPGRDGANDGATSLALRKALAAKAYARTAAYDAAIGQLVRRQSERGARPRATFAGSLAPGLRYGENPHQ